MVGDTVNDIRCARAIGANVIAVATGGTTAAELEAAEPDVLFRVWRSEQLVALLA